MRDLKHEVQPNAIPGDDDQDNFCHSEYRLASQLGQRLTFARAEGSGSAEAYRRVDQVTAPRRGWYEPRAQERGERPGDRGGARRRVHSGARRGAL